MLRRRRAIVAALGGGAAIPWYLAADVLAANCVAAYQPIGADDLADSYINLVNPGTNDAAPGTAPTWNATDGWIFNAFSHLLTGITPESGWSAICRYSGATAANDNMMFGEFTSNASFGIAPNRGVTPFVRYFSGGNLDKTPELAAGVLAIADNVGYRDGVAETGTIPAWGASATSAIVIGGHSATARRAVNIQALAIYNATLTPTQVATVTARMQALPL